MILRFKRSERVLTIDGAEQRFVATNQVRNEVNGLRRLHEAKEVIRSVVNGQWGPPYMPRQFPLGTWNVLRAEPQRRESDFWPWKIVTDAEQLVKVWALDGKGGYDHETEQTVLDSGYHLHWTPYNTTHGCIRVGGAYTDEVTTLASVVRDALKAGEKVQLIVEE